MQTLGKIFQLKEPFTEIKSELTPSFDEVIQSYLGRHVRTKFKDPAYVIEITWPTKPLEIFVKRICEGLTTPSVQGTYLIRGFGFGKTHAIILLWHILNSKEGVSSKLAKSLGVKDPHTRESLVLGIDFSKEEPFSRLFDELEALAKRNYEKWSVKDEKLSQAAVSVIGKVSRTEALSMSSEDLADLIAIITQKYRELGGNPKLLLLIDELGIGIIRRLINYIETGNEERYSEIERMINFIEHLYVRLTGEGIPTIIIVALAEQDLRELEAIHLQQTDKPLYRDKIDGLRKRLTSLQERLSRAAGGLAEGAALSYDPEHAINIAKHRVFKRVNSQEPVDAIISYLAIQAEQLNLTEAFESYKEQIKTYYPLSPSMIWLLKKILDPYDVPRTEYVRTTLYLVAEAAENALTYQPEKSLTVGVNHVPLARAGVVDLMGDFEADWASAVSDMEHAIRASSPELQKTVDFIAKQVLAKGTTANVTMLIEVRDLKELKRYGISQEEMQLDMLAVLTSDEATKCISQVQDAMEYLKTQSARIEEKEYEEQKFYLPSLMRTIYDKLAAFVAEQRRILENLAQLPAYMQQAGVASLFISPKASIPSHENEVTILLKGYNNVSNIEDLLSSEDVRNAQREGNLAIIVVPPWDSFLFNELYLRKSDYHSLVNTLSQKLQSVNLEGKIPHPLHLFVLIPDIRHEKLSGLIDDTISYVAVKDFLKHLANKEKILEEKLYDYEKTIQKRLTLRLTEYFEEQRKKLEVGLRNSIERQVRDARTSAQRELVKLTRKLATSVLELFEEVIFYSLQAQRFMPQSLVKLFGELGGQASRIEERGAESLSDYSLIVNTFFKRVVESTGFTWNSNDVTEALYKHYEYEINSGVLRKQDRISEVNENAMLGAYDVKPLSAKVVHDAILNLDGKIIETEDKKITFKIDETAGLALFQIEEKVKPPEEEKEIIIVEEGIPPVREAEKLKTLSDVMIEIDPGFKYEEFRTRLDSLYKSYGTLISSIKLGASGNVLRASFDFLGAGHSSSTIINVIRFLRQVANIYKAIPYVEIRFTSPLPQDRLEEILGPFLAKKVRRSWDRLLPP
jgi:hypothetical protein